MSFDWRGRPDGARSSIAISTGELEENEGGWTRANQFRGSRVLEQDQNNGK